MSHDYQAVWRLGIIVSTFKHSILGEIKVRYIAEKTNKQIKTTTANVWFHGETVLCKN